MQPTPGPAERQRQRRATGHHHVLTNDTDPDSAINPASMAIVAPPANGTATVNPATGAITFTGTASTSFTYTVKDIFGGVSKPATVTVTVGAAPTAPVAVNDSASTNVATAVAISVLANDTGNNLNPASVAVVAAGHRHGGRQPDDWLHYLYAAGRIRRNGDIHLPRFGCPGTPVQYRRGNRASHGNHRHLARAVNYCRRYLAH